MAERRDDRNTRGGAGVAAGWRRQGRALDLEISLEITIGAAGEGAVRNSSGGVRRVSL